MILLISIDDLARGLHAGLVLDCRAFSDKSQRFLHIYNLRCNVLASALH